MFRMRASIMATGLVVAVAIGIPACSGTDEPTGGNNGVPAAVSPAAIESHLNTVLPAAAAGLADGLTRLLTAATGGPLDGVVLLPVGNVVQAQVGVDFDADGVRETTFSGSGIFSDEALDASQGVTLTLDGVVDPNQPTANVSGSMYMEPVLLPSVAPLMSFVSLTTVTFSGINGHLGVDPPGSGNAYDIYVIDGVVSVDLLTGTPSGWADGWIEAEGIEVDWSAFVETTTVGGWEVTIYGDDFEFTVP